MPLPVHLVGSLPTDITRRGPAHVWGWVQETTPAELISLPADHDSRWIVKRLQSYEDSAAMRVIRPGAMRGYDDTPIYRPTAGFVPPGELFCRAEVSAVDKAVKAYAEVSPTVPLQISRPSPLDLSLFTFAGIPEWHRPLRSLVGSVLAVAHLRSMRQAWLDEIETLARVAPDGAIWQLETPAVLYALNKAPRFLRPWLARVLAKQVATYLADLPGERILHLCYGNLENRELLAPVDTEPVALFLNALATRLSQRGQRLPKVHVPLAFGSKPPPMLRRYYAPLVSLDESWHLIAGVADEHDAEASAWALDHLATLSGRQGAFTLAGVSTACGLGRHNADDAQAALMLCGSLARRPSVE